MRRAALRFLAPLALVLAFTSSAGAVPDPPDNFAIDDAAPGAGWVVPVGIAFLPDGRFLVAEKRGHVYEVRGGVKRSTPLWNGVNEVLDLGDRGLLGIAVDPNYFANHFIYLLYIVDPDSNGTDTNQFAFGRLTRYQVNFTDSATVDPASRTVLMGYNWSNGPVQCSDSHGIGSLRFGRDGSLLVSIGDGAHYEYMDRGGNDGGAFGAGRTDAYEDIGSFRSQDVTSLDGKILRINPATGRGYANNPFVDSNLGSVRSRVWAYGLRNPFRLNVRPGTGIADTAAASPGSLYIGDVGWNGYEEMNLAKTGGLNFGWPCYEGIGAQSSYTSASPAHNGCGSFGTVTNPSAARSPLMSWHHSNGNLSTPTGIVGNAAVGGVFYTGTSYPAVYRGQYLFADHGGVWIKLATLDINDNLISVADFVTAADGPVDLATDPVSGDVFYVAIDAGQVRRIRYTAATGGNRPPGAVIAATPVSGPAPLSVAFSSAGSTDPDGDLLSYAWAFTDGSGSTEANPTHVFQNTGVYNVQLTLSDGRGGTDIKYVTVAVTLPEVAFPATSLLDNFNRADGLVGTPWVDQTTNFRIAANALAPQSGTGYMQWSGTDFGRDQEVWLTFAAIDAAASEQNLMLKTQGATWTSGHIEVGYHHSSSTITVATYAPATGWLTAGILTGVTFANGDRFGARAFGDGSVYVFRNSTRIGTVSVANWPFFYLGGRIGVSSVNASASRFDDFGGGTVVSNANTKPVASIQSPANNSFYQDGQVLTFNGSATDGQSPPDSLSYQWRVDLAHNNHVHPASFNATGNPVQYTATNHDDGTGVHLIVKLIVRDPQGLASDTARVDIWPEIDLVPSAVTVTPDPPTTGQPVAYAFSLANSGRMPANGSRWVLRAGTIAVAQGDTVVPANGSVALVVNGTAPAAGTYALRLRADSLAQVVETNETNNVTMRSLTVNAVPGNIAPLAVALGIPQSGVAPLAVNFSGAASSDANGDSLTFGWAFGDGGTATGRLASRTYTAAGSYAAILTVNDNRGGIDTASVAISVSAPSGTGFPQAAVLDNFNRADGAIGASWIDQPSAFRITDNVLAPGTGDHYIEWNTVFGANQEAFMTLSTIQATGLEHNLMLKTQGTSWSSGHIEVTYAQGTSSVRVITFAPPSAWVPRGTITGVTFAAGDQFGARALADGTVQVFRNGTQIGSVSVSGWAFAALGGRIGISAGRAGSSRFDNFGGGNYVSNLNTPPVASVSSPSNNSFFFTGQSVALNGSATDGQSPAGDLTHGWVLDLVFGNGRVQPAFATFNTASASWTGSDLDDGTGVRVRAKYVARDPQGLVSDTVRVEIFPEIDLAPGTVTVAPDPPTAGQPVTYSFSLANSGRMPANRSRWVLRAGATVVAQGDTVVPANGDVAMVVNATAPAAGAYTLRLRADSLAQVTEISETNNATTRSYTVNAIPGNTPPVAVAVGTPTSGVAPLAVNFSGATSSDANGDSLTFAWTFGDGGTATGRLAGRTYTAAGSYAAILTVQDGRGGTDTASVAISVSAPPGSGFPQTAVLDNFNRANGAIGSPWIDQTSAFRITSNVLAPGAGDSYIQWNTVFGPNQEAFVTLSTIQATGLEHNLMLKTQGTKWSAGHIEVTYGPTTNSVRVITFTPPSAWVTRGTITGVTFAAGNQLGARALADGTVQVFRNGTPIGSVSVAGWAFAAQGGRIGVSAGRTGSSRFDNFGGGNYAAAGPALPSPAEIAASRPVSPGTLDLSPAFPNPTSAGVSFRLVMPQEGVVDMSIVDVQGREVWSRPASTNAAGVSTLKWDGRAGATPAPNGVYLARVRAGGRLFLRRIAIVH